MSLSVCHGPQARHLHQSVPCLSPSSETPHGTEKEAVAPSPGWRNPPDNPPKEQPLTSEEVGAKAREVGANHGVTMPCTSRPYCRPTHGCPPWAATSPRPQGGPQWHQSTSVSCNIGTLPPCGFSSFPCGKTSLCLLDHARPSPSGRRLRIAEAEQGLWRSANAGLRAAAWPPASVSSRSSPLNTPAGMFARSVRPIPCAP